MNVVADAGAVGRVVVGAEDHDALALPQRRLQTDRDQVRLRIMVLAETTTGVAPSHVEVSQCREGESGARGVKVVAEHLFHDELGAAVGVDRSLRA